MSQTSPTITDKRRTFAQLHQSGCFVIPNPWDLGSAHYLQTLGFKALASTSAGFAWSQGRRDGAVTRERVLEHLAELVAATDVPVNADFENGFAHEPAGVADSVRAAVAAGVAGLSIEDSSAHGGPLYELDVAVERMRAARRAIDQAGGDTVLVGRAECFLVGRPDLQETITRLRAYAGAGADCLYAPGLRTREQIGAVVQAVAPRPVNVMAGFPGSLNVAELTALGVRRISVGGALARAAWSGCMRAARQIAEQGRFDELASAASHLELNGLFGQG
jgi:2-methylisocitrate lyase-like PEP mutase family enzyme